MTNWGRALVAGALAMTGGARVSAGQVGHTPETSPYTDLVYRQDLTTFTGYLNTRRDPAGVAPRSGPLAGIRYALLLSGPAQLTARLAYARSERTVLDPLEPASSRVVISDAKVPLLLGDVGLALSLTGFKSWNRLVPELTGGLGFISDFRTEGDVGGFSFGTRFALTLGAGIRYVPTGRLQLRADLTDYLYKVAYPDSYYQAASGQTAILKADQSKSFWTHNPSITFGVSYLFWR
jgi:hypothetical protein